MCTKEEIFSDIQKILKEDYAGYLDKRDINHPEDYTISNDMSDREFEETIQDYLLDFHDGHLGFTAINSELPHAGFFVRRFESDLYVTNSPQEKRLFVGDKIIQIDGKSIEELALKCYKRLEEKLPERQQWDSIIRRSKKVLVERDGDHFELSLANYEPLPYQGTHIFKQLDPITAYIKLTDFAEEAPIQRLIHDNREALEQSENLIIDVRVNLGGNDAFYFPLLHFLFDQDIPFPDLFANDEVMYTNYTNRNCRLYIQEMKEYLNQELDDSTKDMIKGEIDLFEQNHGKGLVEVPEDTDFMINGHANPAHIFVLSDYYCGSLGDTFVSNAKKSPKVTVVGRPTMGIMDYFNVVTVDYGDYEFIYGISKMHQNYSINGQGIEPHIYIPWTPAHLKEDKDLAYVLEKIQNDL
ncbi:S41 family peptidase [Virgibacillus natechei]